MQHLIGYPERHMLHETTVHNLCSEPNEFIRFGFFNQTFNSSSYILIVSISSLTKGISDCKMVLASFFANFKLLCWLMTFSMWLIIWWRERDCWLLTPSCNFQTNMYICCHLYWVFFCRQWNILIYRSFFDCDLTPKDGHISHFPRAFSSRVGWHSSENFLQVLETSCINVS